MMLVVGRIKRMAWFHQVKNPKLKSIKKTTSTTHGASLWKKCVSCDEMIQTEKLEENNFVCPFCQHHYRLSAMDRINVLVDPGSFQEMSADLETTNPLQFSDKMSYHDRLEQAYKMTELKDGTLQGTAMVHGMPISLAVMDFRFMGGSMGVVTGEKITRAMEVSLEKKIPCMVVTCSGGARMQEGILSLMQMAKTSAARARLKKLKIPYFSLLTDPTTGGCAASFAMLGDVNLAEPKALIGFAGPRVIEQSIRQTLPEGFQRSEFLLDHGFIDRIIHRHQLKDELSFFLKLFSQSSHH
jgi:acetyl-CoA carboxylase carboxyl transferase subunit beta